MAKSMAPGTWSARLEPGTKASGSMRSSTASALKGGLTALSTQASLEMGANMDMESLSGSMEAAMWGSSVGIILKAKALISGVTAGAILETGWKIKCTGSESLNGLMEGSMRESTGLIRKMETGPWSKPMGRFIRALGAMAKNMGSGFISLKIARRREGGSRARGLNGSMSELFN